MRRLRYASVACLLTGAASAATLPPLTADGKAATPAGVNFTAPAGWTMSALAGAGAVLTPPEADTHVVVLDIAASAGPKEAAEAAWKLYRAGDGHRVKIVTQRAPHDGWDGAWHIDYEIAPNERADIEAGALRHGKQWTVWIIDGTEATAEKRESAIDLIVLTLRPRGYQRESFAGRSAHRLDAPRIAALRSFVRSSMQQLGVPGAAMALYDHGSVVYEGGLGVRELGKPAAVDAHTRFIVASNTKGMTTLLLAQLVDAKKLAWDEKVTDAYPPFRLGDAQTTRQVLIRHLVCACTGVPRQDLEWYFNASGTTPAANIFAALAHTRPTSKFGETFQYSNIMAAAAGYVAAHVIYPDRELGAAYDIAMQQRVFDPLGMADTTFSFDKALAADHASPHGDDIDGRPAVAAIDSDTVIASARPAGGAWSSAHDMILYIRNELASGRLPDGRQLVSPANLLIRRAPGVAIGEDEWYGMGLHINRSWGVSVLHHGGALDGYTSDFFVIPEADVGAVILTNADNGGYLMRPFMRRLLEILYDGKPEAAGDVSAAAIRHKAERAAERKRLAYPADPALAGKLAARYSSPELGHIMVRQDSAGVTFDFGTWHSRVASRRNGDGTISFITADPVVDGSAFVVSAKSGKRGLVIRDGQHEYVYTECPPGRFCG